MRQSPSGSVSPKATSNFNSPLIGLPKTRDDAVFMASSDPFRFERWAASLVDGMETPVVQIYTVEDYFEGRRPKLPVAA